MNGRRRKRLWRTFLESAQAVGLRRVTGGMWRAAKKAYTRRRHPARGAGAAAGDAPPGQEGMMWGERT